ncbi:glycoside hydrolase family 95 protein [Didymella exigua CBS 183.55]|uniref:Glycoside hydrolase family 95 protein n=1 Tax=Didymella exigua CBS 183.55 TaxID=1150837 RepID=A0A6A5R6D5_9PLEO|nr:glycoside hydrolase family 95 protein [Didymella exigua CBS 183.55]KAF1923685.1 glycoside hydrolase family 95 protein [Didymella exigua CBS 183.55]
MLARRSPEHGEGSDQPSSSATLTGGTSFATQSDLRHPMLRYDSPASDWNGALPLGNGRLGAMVYGGVHKETLRLNEESVWYGGPMNRTPVGAKHHLDELRQLIRAGRHRDAEVLVGKRFLATPKSMRHYEPLGTCTIDFEYSTEQQTFRSEDVVRSYERSLDLTRAEAVVQYAVNGTRVRREIIATHADNTIALRVVADEQISFKISLTRMSDIEWEVNEFLDSIEIIDGCIVLHATPGGKGSNSLCIVAGAQVHGEGGIKVFGRELEITARDAVIVLAAHTQYRHSDVQQAAMVEVEGAMRIGPEALWRRHVEDWQILFNRMSIQLFPNNTQLTTSERLMNSRDPGLTALYHAYARYLLLSCSRTYPKALPANLQGIWNPTFQPPWGSKFTINVNLQMCYWAAHVSNLSECELPLFDLLERMAVNGKQTASEVWGCRGWCAHHCTDIFGDTETQDRWMPSTLWPLGGAWLCTHVWGYYSFTGDGSLLSRMLPAIEGCVDFLLDFLIEDANGQYLTASPSLSPENTFLHHESQETGVFCEGSTMDMEIVRHVFNDFLRIDRVLGVSSSSIHRLSAVESALSRLPPINISSKTGTIQEWGPNDFEETELGHRHVSHLYAIHPGNTLTTSSDPKLVEAAKKTLMRRLEHGGGHTGWSRAWLINFWARLRQPTECYRNIEALLRGSTLPNMLDNHPPFQIDGNFGGAAGIAECLVQSHEEAQSSREEGPVRLLRLLPSCPVEWKKGNVRGARCHGGFELAFDWDDGHIQDSVRVKSLFGHRATVVFHYTGADASDKGIAVEVPAVIGDHNISRGYSDYSRRIDFVKRGFSGYNTVNALSVLPRIIPRPGQGRVRLLSIFFGANDISFPDTTGQHVPLRVFEENLRRLIKHPRVQAHEDIRVLLITPPPIDEWGFEHWDEPGRSARKAATAQKYAEGVRKVGEEMGVAVVDLWTACMEEATVGWNASLLTERGVEILIPGDMRAERSVVLARLLYDGLHLSGDGYKILYQEMKKTIIEAHPDLRPSKIPVALEPFFPEWFEDNAPCRTS